MDAQFNLLANVNFEWLAHCTLDVAVFEATAPAEDERATFVGIGHSDSPKEVATTH